MKQQHLEQQVELLKAQIDQLKNVKLAIIIQNGNIQHIAATNEMKIAVINYDEEIRPDLVVTFTQPDQIIQNIYKCGWLKDLEQEDPVTEYAVDILEANKF